MAVLYSLARISLVTILALIACGFLYADQMHHLADDPGIGWHLRTGEIIARTAQIPHVDPFLAPLRSPLDSVSVDATRTWVCDQWLSDLLLHTAFTNGGWSLVYSLIAALYCCTFFCVLFPELRHQFKTSVIPFGVTLLAFKMAQVHFIVRPVVFSILALAIVYRLASSWERADNTTSTRTLLSRAAVIGAIFALWANLHPGFVLGVIMLAFIPLAKLFERRGSEALVLVVLPVAAMLGSLVSPYGWKLHSSILKLGSSGYFMSLNSEWLPPSLSSPEGVILCTFIGIPLLTLAIRAPMPHLRWLDVLCSSFFLYQATQSVRFLPFAAIVGAAPLASACAGLGAVLFQRFKHTASLLETNEHKYQRVPTVVLSVCLAAMAFALITHKPPLYVGPLGPNESVYPRKALDALLELPSDAVVIAHPNWGGYITFRGFPHVRAIIDDRNTLLGEEFYRAVLPRLKTAQGISELATAFGATHVLLPRAKSFDSGVTLGSVVLQDDVATLIRVKESRQLLR